MKQVLLAIALIAVPVAAFSGFQVYASSTRQAAAPAGLGDLSALKTIIADVQASVAKGDMAAAKSRITDFESAWDQGQTAIRPLNPTYWGNIDNAADAALSSVRSSNPAPDAMKPALEALMATLDDPSKPAP